MVREQARERYREELRRTILDAAREAFAELGYDGLSMRMLADRVGCSHGSLYLYFRDKEELFETLVRESFDELSAWLRQTSGGRSRTDPVRLLRKAGRRYAEFGLQNPAAYQFAFVLRRPASKGDQPHESYQLLRALVKRCIDEKRFQRIDPDAASQALWAAVHGVTALLISRPSFPWTDRDALIGRVVDHAIDGLLARK